MCVAPLTECSHANSVRKKSDGYDKHKHWTPCNDSIRFHNIHTIPHIIVIHCSSNIATRRWRLMAPQLKLVILVNFPSCPTFPNQSVDNGTIWNVSPGILRCSGAQTVDLAKSDILFATERCVPRDLNGSDYIWLTSPEAASRAARHRWSLGYGMILCCGSFPCQAGTDGDAQTSPLIRKAKQEDSRESPQAMMGQLGHVFLQSRSRNCRKWKLRTNVNEHMRINRSEPVSSNINIQ